jgi:hypothetical protein
MERHHWNLPFRADRAMDQEDCTVTCEPASIETSSGGVIVLSEGPNEPPLRGTSDSPVWPRLFPAAR